MRTGLSAEMSSHSMDIEVLADPESVAQRAASTVTDAVWAAMAARGSLVMAVSGGHTPWITPCALADAQIPCQAVHVIQVDEGVAPAGHTDRNLTDLKESLLAHAPLPRAGASRTTT